MICGYIKKKSDNKPNKSKSPLLPHVNLFSPLVRSHKTVLGIAAACFQHSPVCPCVAFQVTQFNGPLVNHWQTCFEFSRRQGLSKISARTLAQHPVTLTSLQFSGSYLPTRVCFMLCVKAVLTFCCIKTALLRHLLRFRLLGFVLGPAQSVASLQHRSVTHSSLMTYICVLLRIVWGIYRFVLYFAVDMCHWRVHIDTVVLEVWSYVAQLGLWKSPQSRQACSQLLFNGNVIRLLNYRPRWLHGKPQLCPLHGPEVTGSDHFSNHVRCHSWCHLSSSVIQMCRILPGASVPQNKWR